MNSVINHPYHDKASEGMPFYKLIIRCAVFLLIFALVAVISALICSAIFFKTENPTSKIQLASLISLYLSVAVCSVVLTRINGERWLFGGLILGFMIYFSTLMLAFFIKDTPSTSSIILRALIPVISTFFAFLSRKRDKKHHKSRIKRHKFKT